MKKRLFALLGLAALLVSLLCACGENAPKTADENIQKNESVKPESVKTEPFTTEAYSFDLPETVTAEEGADGGLTLFLLDGEDVGGVQIIPYEDARALRADDMTTEAGRVKFNELLVLVCPEDKVDHMFSASTEGSFCLDVIPHPGEDAPESIHYFFPKEDVFYDLFFQRNGFLSETEEQVIRDSFVLAS